MNCFSRVSGIIIFCMLKVIYETTNNKNQIHRFTALIHIVIFKNIFFPQQASEASILAKVSITTPNTLVNSRE